MVCNTTLSADGDHIINNLILNRNYHIQHLAIHMKTSSLEYEAHRLMEVWAKEYRDPSPSPYAASPLDGNLALLETRNHINRSFHTATGKESRRARLINEDTDTQAVYMESVLTRLANVKPAPIKSLCLYYLYESDRRTSEIMDISKSFAQQLKKTGMAMVMVEIS